MTYVHKHDPKWKEEIRECLECKTEFSPRAWNQKYCTARCCVARFSFERIHNDPDSIPEGGTYRWLKARVVVFDRDKFTCQYCGRSPQKDSSVVLHVDHKVPKKKGGTDALHNLITSCRECNLGKEDMLLTYWQNEKG